MNNNKPHHKSKLNEEQVRHIKRLLRSGMQHNSIAKKFGVTRNAITSIKAGKSWKYVR